uniref:Nuclear prelamin A recognition factor n=1 Tax=Myotis myotis TaxID=51298 RepID=A0A7J7Z4W6_MYOMY|nr:hypothetical protein mMyoMyo1_010640 [Myotis myotis]
MKCDHCKQKECSKITKTDDQEHAAVSVRSPAQNGEKGEFHKLADAKIFLRDCLACDSCVTAEEGVQVSPQNTKVFFCVLNLNKNVMPHSTRCWQCPCVLSLCLILLLNSASVSLMQPEGSVASGKALGHTVFDMKIVQTSASWRVRRNLCVGTASYPC